MYLLIINLREDIPTFIKKIKIFFIIIIKKAGFKNLAFLSTYVFDWLFSNIGWLSYYIKKETIFLIVSLFSLIDNVKYVKYNFSGKTYEVKRENVELYFPNYEDIVKKVIEDNVDRTFGIFS